MNFIKLFSPFYTHTFVVRHHGEFELVKSKVILTHLNILFLLFIYLALALKSIDYEYKAINLLKQEQLSEEYKKMNPKGEIPCLFINNNYLTQSVKIL